jgi:hypothetical protein
MTTRILSLTFLVALTLATAEEPAARPYWRTVVRGTHGMVDFEIALFWF